MLSGKTQLKKKKKKNSFKMLLFSKQKKLFFVRSDYKNTNLNAFSSIQISFIIYFAIDYAY